MDSMKPTIPGLTVPQQSYLETQIAAMRLRTAGLHMQVQARQPVAPTNCPADMDDETLRAHGLLHGLPLLPEWRRFVTTMADSDRYFRQGRGMEQGGYPSAIAISDVFTRGRRLRTEAFEQWRQATEARFGNETLHWEVGFVGCTVAGERYTR